MAALTVVATTVEVVQTIQQLTAPANADSTRGWIMRFDTSSGKWVRATSASAGTAGTVRGMAVKTVKANFGLTVVRHGIMNLGEALAALAFDAPVYLNDDGSLGDAAGTVSIVLGRVIPGWASGSNVDKLLLLTP